MSGHLCIKCSCDLVGWRGDLVRVASWRRQGLGRAENTLIKAVETTETESKAIYNLAGQRVSKMQKGIYIVNGKKVLVK